MHQREEEKFELVEIKLLYKKIKLIRQIHRLTQQQIADVFRIDRTTYTYYEVNKTNISTYTLYNLCRYYNIDINYFLDDTIDLRTFEKIVKNNM